MLVVFPQSVDCCECSGNLPQPIFCPCVVRPCPHRPHSVWRQNGPLPSFPSPLRMTATCTAQPLAFFSPQRVSGICCMELCAEWSSIPSSTLVAQCFFECPRAGLVTRATASMLQSNIHKEWLLRWQVMQDPSSRTIIEWCLQLAMLCDARLVGIQKL
jgi:hypothetical protein